MSDTELKSFDSNVTLLIGQLESAIDTGRHFEFNSDFKSKQWLEDFQNQHMYEFNYTSFFPQYVEHGINSELVCRNFFTAKHCSYVVANKFGNKYMLEDHKDFEHFYWAILDDTCGYYNLLANLYHGIYFLYRHSFILKSWLNMARFRSDDWVYDEFYDVPEINHRAYCERKKKEILWRYNHCIFYVERFMNKLNTEIYLNQIVFEDKIKSLINNVGQTIWYYKQETVAIKKGRKKVSATIVDFNLIVPSGTRLLWANDISSIVLMYIMDLHPMNDSLVK